MKKIELKKMLQRLYYKNNNKSVEIYNITKKLINLI